jgi:hypothetical protein
MILNAKYFGFRSYQGMAFQCMRLADHVTVNFNYNLPTAAVLVNINKALDTTWHSGLLHTFSEFGVPQIEQSLYI